MPGHPESRFLWGVFIVLSKQRWPQAGLGLVMMVVSCMAMASGGEAPQVAGIPVDFILFALTLLGFAVIGAGLWWQRHEAHLVQRLRALLPEALRELLEQRQG